MAVAPGAQAAAEAPARLRAELLRETVAWCTAHSSFYRERFPPAEEIRGLEDLTRLPVLFREDVVANYEALVCDPTLPAAVLHTTGTTGAFLEVMRGRAEQAFVWDFFAAQQAVSGGDGVRPLHLSLVNAYHGSLTPMPTPAYVLSASVHDEAQASQARGILERTYALPGVEPRVSTVMGTERMVKALTAYLVADGFDLAGSSVRTVVLFGGHVSAARKRLLEELWGANVTDQYSLTEVFGGAREAGIGGPWVFDPHVIPEVVHPRTLEPVERGIGVLLLSGLYPFVQQMPLVRYFTGDLVELESASAAGPQVRYAGRLSRSVIDAAGTEVLPLLLSGPLYEALEELPDLAITPRFGDLPASPGLELTGDLHYAVEHAPTGRGGAPEITIRLGLRYAPWMFPTRLAEVRERLVKRLHAAHPELERRCAEGSARLRIEFHDAAEIAPYDSK
jgi:phenylacetate-coenzyme A ligase PaaK-like adenylate-forming protein